MSSKNTRKYCSVCNKRKVLSYFYDLKNGKKSHKCKKCEKEEANIFLQMANNKNDYNQPLYNGQYIIPEITYRTDTRIEEIEGKTYLIIPSKMNNL